MSNDPGPSRGLAPGTADLASRETESGELRRRLTQRQLSMLAIGGAIGVGLFLGSSVTIRLAGPGVIITYLFSAVIALIVAYSIAEMAVVHPVAGSFGICGASDLRIRSDHCDWRRNYCCRHLFRLLVPVGAAMGLGGQRFHWLGGA